jgi:hypothetical protein
VKKEKRSMTQRAVDAPASAARVDLYEHDYYTWAMEQGRALRARNTETLDWENLAEEVESLGRGEARELESRLEVLLLHLLKWRYQPKKRSSSWRLTIRVQRQRVSQVMSENPGLKTKLGENLSAAYDLARLLAAGETGLDERIFPPTSPWSFEQITDGEFWPNS